MSRWRPFITRGRKQFRIGIYRRRGDRVCYEYRFLGIERGW